MIDTVRSIPGVTVVSTVSRTPMTGGFGVAVYNVSRRMKELGIRCLMHVIFECAARWELFNERRNPIEMVRVKEPCRTMVVVAQCLGRYLKPAGIKLGLGTIGWHTYRSWLDETGAPMKVQQELMRHASIQTTMNVYGQAMSSSKREANGKVVEMVRKLVKASA